MNLFQILTLLLLLLFPKIFAQSEEVIDWDYEIDLLARELAEVHPDLFFHTDSSWYFHEMNEVAAGAPGHSIFQVSVRLQQVLAAMGDAHTQINYHFLIDKSRILPLDCYWFEEGIYILKTDRLYDQLLGKKLVAINRVPIEVVIDSLSTLLVIDSQSVLKNSIPRMLTWFQVLEYFGFTSGNSVTMTVSNPSGTEEEAEIKVPLELGEMLAVKPTSIPLGWQDQKTFFWDRYYENEHLYYIQYNRCWSREAEEDYGSGASALFMPSFKEFEKQVFPVIKKRKIDKLVFDMRFNKGGHASQGTEFIKKICKTLPGDHDAVYVLVGRTTCAEAIINTVDFMRCTKVILVGEETCGKPNYFGEVKRFVLPESRLIVSHPTISVRLMDEDYPAVKPDMLTPIGFEQYMKGIDPAIEAVRSKALP
ncbi:MAG: hypothetical protein U9R49_00755 [Bacteroidota bacterium]|nr:hypothetical protein [Bacteroidota bacterium]